MDWDALKGAAPGLRSSPCFLRRSIGVGSFEESFSSDDDLLSSAAVGTWSRLKPLEDLGVERGSG